MNKNLVEVIDNDGNGTGLMVDVPVMLTIDEAHRAYKLSKQHLYQLAKSGKVRGTIAGKNRIYISADSLTEHLRNGSLQDQKEVKAINGIRPLG